MSEKRPRIAATYNLTPMAFDVDGEQFPWHIAEEGPRVESLGSDMPLHILWVPILIDAPLPEYAHEKPGQPVEPVCGNHKPVQHRDGKPPWCNACRKG